MVTWVVLAVNGVVTMFLSTYAHVLIIGPSVGWNLTNKGNDR